MTYKLLIGSLAICTLSACTDNGAQVTENNDNLTSGGYFTNYGCKGKNDSDTLTKARASFSIDFRTIRKTSQTQPEFKMPRVHLKGFALYEADINYQTSTPNPDNPDSFIARNIFEYKNVEFEYDKKELILKTPQDGNLPACQLRFAKDGKMGEHKCEFKKNDVGYRAVTFDFACDRWGKIGVFTEPEK